MTSRNNGYNASLFDTEDGECWKCHAVCDTARHEVYYGTGTREQSKKAGLWVCLCPRCHAMVHSNPNDGLDAELKEIARKIYLRHHTEVEFRARFISGYVKGWE